MNEFSKFHDEIDDALTQSARDLRRLAEFYRRHGKVECAYQVEQSLPKEETMEEQSVNSLWTSKQKTPGASQFHWLHLPEKKVG
jgi:hypothetical protein